MSFEDDEYWEAEYSDQAVGYADNTAIAHDRYAYVDRPVPSRNGSGGGGSWDDDADDDPEGYDELAVRRQRRQRSNAQSASREQRIRAAFDADRPSWLDDPAFAGRGGRGGPRTGEVDRDPDRRSPAPAPDDWDEQGDDWDTAQDEWEAPAADWDEPRDRRRATTAEVGDWDPRDDGPIRRPGGRRTGGGPSGYEGPPADRPASGRARVPEQPVSDPPLDLYLPPKRRNGSGDGADGEGRPDVRSGDPRSGDGFGRATVRPGDRPDDGDDSGWADEAPRRGGRARRGDEAAWADEPGRRVVPGRDDTRRGDRPGPNQRPADWADDSQGPVGWAGNDGRAVDRTDSDRRTGGRSGRTDRREPGWTDQPRRATGWAGQPGPESGWAERADGETWAEQADGATWAEQADGATWAEQADGATWAGQGDRESRWEQQDEREVRWEEQDARGTGWADRAERDRREGGQSRRDRPGGQAWPEDDVPAARRDPRGYGDRSRRGPADDDRRGGPRTGDRRDDVLHGELLPPDPRRHRPQPGEPAAGPGTSPEQYDAPHPGQGGPGWTGGPFPGPGFPGWTGPGFPGPWGPGFAGPGWDGPPWERPGYGAPGWTPPGRPPEFAQRDATPLADRPAAVEPDDDERWSPAPTARGSSAVADPRRDTPDDAERWDDDREPYSGHWGTEPATRPGHAADPDRYDRPFAPAARDYDEPGYDRPADPAVREYDRPLDPAARMRPERGDGDGGRDERRAEPQSADTGPRVLSKASPPTAPRIISKATPPPAPRVIKKAEPPATPRVVGTPSQVGPARVIPPAPPAVPPGVSPAAITNPSGTVPAAAPTSPVPAPAETGIPVSPAPAGTPSAQSPATSPDPRPASGVPGGAPVPRVRPPVPPPGASPAGDHSVPGAARSAAPPSGTSPRAVPPPVVPAAAPAPPAVPPRAAPPPAAAQAAAPQAAPQAAPSHAAPGSVVPAAAAPPPAVPGTSPSGASPSGVDRRGAAPPDPTAPAAGPVKAAQTHPAPVPPAPATTPPPAGGRPSVQTAAGDVPLKPVARLATSGPDTTPRRYADAGLSGGWFTSHADAQPAAPDATAAPVAAGGVAAPSPDRAADTPGMTVDLDITDMLTNLATGQQPVVVPHPTLPADEEPADGAGDTTAERPEPSVMARPAPDEPKAPARPLKPLSAEDLAAIRWRLDGGTLREVVDDRDALRELGARLDEPLAGEADHATRAGLLSVRAEVYRLLDELGMAAAASRLALSHAESSGDVQAIVIAQAELAHVLRLRGDHAEADRLFEVAASSEAPPVLRSVVHENAGRSCFDQGRHMEALDHFARAIRLGDPEDLDLVERIDVSLEAVYIHVLRDGWGPYPRLRREILGAAADRPAPATTG
ncbi:hypothetical protein [Krasilnikovia sp. MM14-A1004]|uniref:hypothetical protein n=1 Tax=Krasilnikovia sp. MM14-A1004 TaxID=3373541 RepID=UPI00399CA33E